MVVIKTKFLPQRVPEVAEHICKVLRHTSSLTPRSVAQVKDLLASGNVAVAYDDSEVIGWLIAAPRARSVRELSSVYIVKHFRNHHLLTKMVDRLLDDSQQYIAVVYDRRLADYLIKRYSFRPSSLWEFVRLTRGEFLGDRLNSFSKMRAVIMHLRTSSPWYLYKNSGNW